MVFKPEKIKERYKSSGGYFFLSSRAIISLVVSWRSPHPISVSDPCNYFCSFVANKLIMIMMIIYISEMFLLFDRGGREGVESSYNFAF